jgi:hypothetical protein
MNEDEKSHIKNLLDAAERGRPTIAEQESIRWLSQRIEHQATDCEVVK